MKIVEVEYRRLVTHGGYNNTAIGATAEVHAGETPTDVLAHTKEWVDGRLAEELKVSEQINDVSTEYYRWQTRLRAVQRNLESARRSWDTAKAVLESHGIAYTEWKEPEYEGDEPEDRGMPF